MHFLQHFFAIFLPNGMKLSEYQKYEQHWITINPSSAALFGGPFFMTKATTMVPIIDNKKTMLVQILVLFVIFFSCLPNPYKNAVLNVIVSCLRCNVKQVAN
jgi:hypothetical protein